MDNNSVNLVGNISCDPVQMGGQKGGVRFDIAVYRGKDSNGNPKSIFIQIKSFDDHNEYHKGQRITVTNGTLDISKGSDGKYYTSVLTGPNQIGVVGSNGRQPSNGNGYQQNGNNYHNGGNNNQSYNRREQGVSDEDIIPF